MAWVTVSGLEGKVYVPDDTRTQKKHPCTGCFSCQWCDENRCQVCRHQGATDECPDVCRSKCIPRPASKIDSP
jgi:hypothetical protein